MTYKLKFLPSAFKEWKKLAPPIRNQFKQKLEERLITPHVGSAKLRGYESVYKIKLKAAGYRLAYQVIDDEVIIYVLAVGKRENDSVYKKLSSRMG